MGNELSKNPFTILYDLATEAVDFTVNFTIGLPFQLIDPAWKPFGDYTPGHLQLGGLDQDWKTALEDTATIAIAVASGNPVFMTFAATQGMADLTGVRELGLQNDLNTALGDRAGMYVGFAAQVAGGYGRGGGGTSDMLEEKVPEQIEMVDMTEKSRLQTVQESNPAPAPAPAPIEYNQAQFQANNGADTFRPSQAYSRSRAADPSVDMENKYNTPQRPFQPPVTEPTPSFRQRLAERYQAAKQRVASWYRARNTREPNVVYTRIPESELGGFDLESEMRDHPLGDLPDAEPELKLDENPPIIQLDDHTNALDEPFPEDEPVPKKASDRIVNDMSRVGPNTQREIEMMRKSAEGRPRQGVNDVSSDLFHPYTSLNFPHETIDLALHDLVPAKIPEAWMQAYKQAIYDYKLWDKATRKWRMVAQELTDQDKSMAPDQFENLQEAVKNAREAKESILKLREEHQDWIKNVFKAEKHFQYANEAKIRKIQVSERQVQEARRSAAQRESEQLRRTVIRQDVNDALAQGPRAYNAQHWRGLGDQAKSIGDIELARKAYATKTAIEAVDRLTAKQMAMRDLKRDIAQADREFGDHQNPQRWLHLAERASRLGDVELSRYAHAKKTALRMIDKDRLQTLADIKQVAEFQAEQLPEPSSSSMVLDTPDNFGLRQRHAQRVNAIVADSAREIVAETLPKVLRGMQGTHAANYFGQFVDNLAGRDRVFSYNTDFSARVRYSLNRIAYFIQNNKFREAKAELQTIVHDPAFTRYQGQWNINLEQTQLAVQKALNNAMDSSLRGSISNDSHTFLREFAKQLFELEFDREGHVSPYETRRMWWTLLRRTFETGLYLHPQRSTAPTPAASAAQGPDQPQQGFYMPLPAGDPDYAVPDPYIDQTVQLFRLLGRMARALGPLYAWYAAQQLEQIPYTPMAAYGQARPASSNDENLSHPHLKKRRLLPVRQH